MKHKPLKLLDMLKFSYFIIAFCIILISCDTVNKKNGLNGSFLKVGFIGAPSYPNVEWSEQNLQKLKAMGFNTMQLNIAWACRPNDEPLNLEDVVSLPDKFALMLDKDSLAKELRTKERVEKRRKELKKRIALCRKLGLRTIFHFGAPFIGYPEDAKEPLENCISDNKTIDRYIFLINEFYHDFPEVDDLLVYTYDQNAWLCSEFGSCEKCHGVPLDQRVSNFLNILGKTWKKNNPNGTLWWEPWELSAGQVYKTMDFLDSSCIGLSIHSNISEVQIASPADRWFKNMLQKAAEKKMDVLGEVWLGSATEEMEPYTNIPTPLATIRALRAIYQAGKLKGIKEYYGIIPGKEDPNLRISELFFANPEISDSEALTSLSAPYKKVATEVAQYWRLVSEAVEMYPWDVSWFAREVGRNNPDHLLTAAVLKGATWETPSWQSSRRVAFMRTLETDAPHFWMREDIQLRFEQAAQKMEDALDVANKIEDKIPDAFWESFSNGLKELGGFHRTTIASVYHLRETNLADVMRKSLSYGYSIKHENIIEMKELLTKDRANRNDKASIDNAIKMLDEEGTKKFLETYFIFTSPSNIYPVWNITSN